MLYGNTGLHATVNKLGSMRRKLHTVGIKDRFNAMTLLFVLIRVTLKMFQALELLTLICNVKQLNSSKIVTI